jgi:threonine aldolase
LALQEANQGYASSYGNDHFTQKAKSLIQKEVGRECQVLIVPTGTGANILSLKLALRCHESAVVTEMAHVQTNETGAAEAVVGCKLLTVSSILGKVTPDNVLKRIRSERLNGPHATSPKLLSITQPTEVGTVYTLEEIKALANLCREENLYLHMDGSRLYNAAVSLGVSLSTLTQYVDILSLGGTKNGLVGAEALVIFNPAFLGPEEYFRKQTLQLTSKMRYLSVQFFPFFEKGLWKQLATNSNKKALEIASILESCPGYRLNYPVDSNQIFFSPPKDKTEMILEHVYCYLWNEEKNEIRFVTSWNTTEEDVLRLRTFLNQN